MSDIFQCECGAQLKKEHLQNHSDKDLCRITKKDGSVTIRDPNELAQAGVYRVGRKFIRLTMAQAESMNVQMSPDSATVNT